MCGIAGILGESCRDPRVIESMIDAVAHRGPDDAGTWFDDSAQVALGHRRLSIVDLSPAGHQPMQSADGRFVLTFNGEIYNFAELRDSIEQQGIVPEHGWRGHSDTEVFLHAISSWGLERALAASSGMFAFALWDRLEKRLALVRDRFGEKPLYYGWVGSQLVFGSELKALRAHPEFDNTISSRAVSHYRSRNHIPAPLSIYERIFKLPPGCLLEVTSEAARKPLDTPPSTGASIHGVRLKQYWSYKDVVTVGLENPVCDEHEAKSQLELALARSVRQQSLADVPVGAFLSGGVDSSLITALYQEHSSRQVRTFAIGFDEAEYNEANDAMKVARHLGTKHEEHYVTASEAGDIIPMLPSMYDEPFADPSQIPTHLVCRAAGSSVKVALTGDGGDELFGGYYHHILAPQIWRILQVIPRSARKSAISQLSRVSPQFWNTAARLLSHRNQAHIGAKIKRVLFGATDADNLNDIYRLLMEDSSFGTLPEVAAVEADFPIEVDAGQAAGALRMMYLDATSFLPDDILCKVDRAAMSVGLETRAPFLDHRVAEVAARIPLSMKVAGGRGKVILRKLLHTYVPPRLVNRPKNGFAAPVGEWIKGPLRSWADELLHERVTEAEAWFDPATVSTLWRDHLAGKRDSTAPLWTILMFRSWLRAERAVERAFTRAHPYSAIRRESNQGRSPDASRASGGVASHSQGSRSPCTDRNTTDQPEPQPGKR